MPKPDRHEQHAERPDHECCCAKFGTAWRRSRHANSATNHSRRGTLGDHHEAHADAGKNRGTCHFTGHARRLAPRSFCALPQAFRLEPVGWVPTFTPLLGRRSTAATACCGDLAAPSVSGPATRSTGRSTLLSRLSDPLLWPPSASRYPGAFVPPSRLWPVRPDVRNRRHARPRRLMALGSHSAGGCSGGAYPAVRPHAHISGTRSSGT